jgi:hypothetical protein
MMHLDLHLTDATELRAHSRVDDTGRPFAEITWDFHGPCPTRAATTSCGAPPPRCAGWPS